MYNEPSIGPDTEDNTVDKVLFWSLFHRVENTNTDKDVYMSSILMISTNRNKPRKVTSVKMRGSEGSVLSVQQTKFSEGREVTLLVWMLGKQSFGATRIKMPRS